jgi:ferredoxin-fold anticodon binding domain-containing protein
MCTIDLLKENPLAFEAMRKWHRDEIMENSKDLPLYFVEMLEKEIIDESVIERITDANPRNWFDFFDSYNLCINITTEKGEKFSYTIVNDHASVGSTYMSKTRKEADKEAIIAAIKMLNTTLTNQVIDKENS